MKGLRAMKLVMGISEPHSSASGLDQISPCCRLSTVGIISVLAFSSSTVSGVTRGLVISYNPDSRRDTVYRRRLLALHRDLPEAIRSSCAPSVFLGPLAILSHDFYLAPI